MNEQNDKWKEIVQEITDVEADEEDKKKQKEIELPQKYKVVHQPGFIYFDCIYFRMYFVS